MKREKKEQDWFLICQTQRLVSSSMSTSCQRYRVTSGRRSLRSKKKPNQTNKQKTRKNVGGWGWGDMLFTLSETTSISQRMTDPLTQAKLFSRTVGHGHWATHTTWRPGLLWTRHVKIALTASWWNLTSQYFSARSCTHQLTLLQRLYTHTHTHTHTHTRKSWPHTTHNDRRERAAGERTKRGDVFKAEFAFWKKHPREGQKTKIDKDKHVDTHGGRGGGTFTNSALKNSNRKRKRISDLWFCTRKNCLMIRHILRWVCIM